MLDPDRIMDTPISGTAFTATGAARPCPFGRPPERLGLPPVAGRVAAVRGLVACTTPKRVLAR